MADFEKLIQYVNSNTRVCPQPQKWAALWEMLPSKRRVGFGWEPPLPLILAAWWDASDEEKHERLLLHIEYAYNCNKLQQIENYLYSLKEDDWYHNKYKE